MFTTAFRSLQSVLQSAHENAIVRKYAKSREPSVTGGQGRFPWEDQWPEITDQLVRNAFARVPRRSFIHPNYRAYAERDRPLPIGEGQTISQPFVVALMTQALALRPGDKVLEIGTGSGFQTAILCELTADDRGDLGKNVYTVERFGDLVRRAQQVLDKLGYRPHIAMGDGAAGWVEHAPYDAIIVTAAPTHLPRRLWEQLCEGGRMVIPIGRQEAEQTLWLLRKHAAGYHQKQMMGPVRFVPLVSPLLADASERLSIDDL